MQKNRRGFTLIELLAVLCVIAILVLLILPRFLGQTKEAQFTRLIHDAKVIEQTLTRYYVANGKWPIGEKRVISGSQIAYDISQQKDVVLDPNQDYYNVDFNELGRYVAILSDPNSFILDVLQNPDDIKVYILRSDISSASEPQPLRQPGSDEIPIYTSEQLASIGKISDYPLDAKYILMANLDLSGYASGEGWDPIGSDTAYFTGAFNGNGLVIKNLTINRPTSDCQGLFASTGSTAKLTNIKLENVNVFGNYCTGGLVGYNLGTIENSYSTGSVRGFAVTGGLAGINDSGTIENSCSTGSVTGIYTTGGLIGMNDYGTVTNSYSTGSVTGSDSGTGGLVGENYGDITNSYSAGKITGSSETGGLVGIDDGTITSSYWDTQTSGMNTSAGGVGKTTAQMKQQSTFTGWDFNTVWAIEEGVSYPYLRSNEQIPHPGTSQ